MKSIIAMLTLTALATATPMLTPRTGKGVGEADKACGSNVVSCCNPTNKESSSGFLAAIVGPIASNGCLGVGANAVPVLSLLGDAQSMCGDNEVKCCTGNKNNGVLVVDAECTSL